SPRARPRRAGRGRRGASGRRGRRRAPSRAEVTSRCRSGYFASPMSFRHEALLYAGRDEFVDRVGAFVRDAMAADEPVLAVVDSEKIDLLRRALGGDAEGVFFADMHELGGNPARIIPAWREFVAAPATTGRRVRGVGEPIWPGRSEAELAECRRHESLLNLAFADGRSWWLVCPYDTEAL